MSRRFVYAIDHGKIICLNKMINISIFFFTCSGKQTSLVISTMIWLHLINDPVITCHGNTLSMDSLFQSWIEYSHLFKSSYLSHIMCLLKKLNTFKTVQYFLHTWLVNTSWPVSITFKRLISVVIYKEYHLQ